MEQLVTASGHPPDDIESPLPHVPMASQTQDDNEDYTLLKEDPDLHKLIRDRGKYFDDIVTHVNTHFDVKDGVLAADLE